MLYKKWSLCYKLNSAVLLRAMPSVVAPGLQGDGWHRKRRPVCWYGGLASTCHLAQVRAGLWRGRRECLLSYHTGHRCWVCGTSTRDYKIKTRTHTLTHTINHTHTNTHTHTITHSHTLLSTDDYKKKLTHTHVRTHAHAHAHNLPRTHIHMRTSAHTHTHTFKTNTCLCVFGCCLIAGSKTLRLIPKAQRASLTFPMSTCSRQRAAGLCRTWWAADLKPTSRSCRGATSSRWCHGGHVNTLWIHCSCEYIVQLNTLFVWIHCSCKNIVHVNTLVMWIHCSCKAYKELPWIITCKVLPCWLCGYIFCRLKSRETALDLWENAIILVEAVLDLQELSFVW